MAKKLFQKFPTQAALFAEANTMPEGDKFVFMREDAPSEEGGGESLRKIKYSSNLIDTSNLESDAADGLYFFKIVPPEGYYINEILDRCTNFYVLELDEEKKIIFTLKNKGGSGGRNMNRKQDYMYIARDSQTISDYESVNFENIETGAQWSKTYYVPLDDYVSPVTKQEIEDFIGKITYYE